MVIALTAFFKLVLLYDFNSLPLLGDEYKYWQNSPAAFNDYFSRLNYQGPVYFIFLAINRIIWQDRALLMIRTEQILLHSLEIYLIYLLACQYFSKKQALVSGIIAAVYPELVSYSYLIFSEIIFLAFLLPAALLYFLALKKPGRQAFPYLIICGILNGLASLTRSINLLFLPLIILHLLVFKKDHLKMKIFSSLIFILAMLAPVSVQTIKNYRVAHCLVLIDTCTGQNFYKSHNVESSPRYDFNEYERPVNYSRPRCRAGNICQRTRCEIKNALEFISSNPGLTLRRSGVKIIELYVPNLFIYKNILPKMLHPRNYIYAPDENYGEKLGKYRGSWFRVIGSVSYLLLMLLALLGLFASKGWEFRSFTILLILYYTAVCAFFFVVSRYRIPFMPFLIIYAGFFLGMTRDQFRNLERWKLLAAIAVWVLLLVLTFPRLLLILQ